MFTKTSIDFNTATPQNKFPVSNFRDIKLKVLNWMQQFGTFCFFDNNEYPSGYHSVEVLAAAGAADSISANSGNALQKFQQALNEKKGWWFGHLGYDLKNEIEKGQYPVHHSETGFPDLHFFRPEILIRLSANEMVITANGNEETIYKEILESSPVLYKSAPEKNITFGKRFSREEYISVIKKLQQHILRGDCYEINFCQEFFVKDISIDPLRVYISLCRVSPNPFSAFYKTGENYLICASPERYLKKEGNIILSQPIKGTSRRFPEDTTKDLQSRKHLLTSEKDRSENVMVVDLVRNDLSRICKESTVRTEELFGVYSFPQVHQMISTISGELKDNTSFEEIIGATFPMGSMTGAPKRKVLELIEKYEHTRRGIFSGAVGYIAPGQDFDFNVVIRSIIYNEKDRYLSFPAGSGITFYSDPEKEYEECLVKAAAIRKVLSGND